jgi:hypothetical protein
MQPETESTLIETTGGTRRVSFPPLVTPEKGLSFSIHTLSREPAT